ncbi:unnamed protein product [Peniophora sp. CBMAI 1063]|nr:unnamed protein product [Peniophora sp. CBMAI 1063]
MRRVRQPCAGPPNGTWRSVKNDHGDLWYAILEHVIYEVEDDDDIVRKVFCVYWWSRRQLIEAIEDGEVNNPEVLLSQLADIEDDWWVLAVNHADYILSQEQVITGVTQEEMRSGRLGSFEPDYFLMIEDVPGTDVGDPQRPRDFNLLSRSELRDWLST